MKSVIVVFLIGLITAGPFFYQLMIPGDATIGDSHELVSESMLSKVGFFTNTIAACWITLGLALAYIIFRFTFGKRVFNKLSLVKFSIFSLIPTIAFAITFIAKQPSEVLMLLSEGFGSLAPTILTATAFFFALALHGITSSAVDPTET